MFDVWLSTLAGVMTFSSLPDIFPENICKPPTIRNPDGVRLGSMTKLGRLSSLQTLSQVLSRHECVRWISQFPRVCSPVSWCFSTRVVCSTGDS